jgi:hypothetical protein
VLSVCAGILSAEAERIEFSEGERVVFLGNTFAERLQYFGYFESILQYRFPGSGLVVRNMGWSADEVGLMPRPLNFEGGAGNLYANDTNVGYDVPSPTEVDFKMLKAHLAAREADTVFLFFGANESFKGEAGLDAFARDYQKLIDQLRSENFNGRSAPRLILVSPVPQERLGPPHSDPAARNEVLRIYSRRVGELATANGLRFADIFDAVAGLMSAPRDAPLTIDGLQLNAEGQRLVAEILAASLGLNGKWRDDLETLRTLVVEKDRQFFFRWRPINAEYIFGRRKEPFGVISFPPEMAELDRIAAELDEKIHAEARKLGSPE